MALTVAPAPLADSFASIVQADAFHGSRGNEGWAALAETRKEQLLRQGTDYMTGTYGRRWVDGVGNLETDDVPPALANACAILALRAKDKPLAPDMGPAVVRKKVDVLEIQYAEGAKQTVTFTEVDNMLAQYLRGFSINIPLVRV